MPLLHFRSVSCRRRTPQPSSSSSVILYTPSYVVDNPTPTPLFVGDAIRLFIHRRRLRYLRFGADYHYRPPHALLPPRQTAVDFAQSQSS